MGGIPSSKGQSQQSTELIFRAINWSPSCVHRLTKQINLLPLHMTGGGLWGGTGLVHWSRHTHLVCISSSRIPGAHIIPARRHFSIFYTTKAMPDATFTSTCCDIFLFLLSLSPSHSLWRLTTDRNFKFNSPFSAGCQVTTPKVANPPQTPTQRHLVVFLCRVCCRFPLAFYYVYGKCGIPEDILLYNFLTSR